MTDVSCDRTSLYEDVCVCLGYTYRPSLYPPRRIQPPKGNAKDTVVYPDEVYSAAKMFNPLYNALLWQTSGEYDKLPVLSQVLTLR